MSRYRVSKKIKAGILPYTLTISMVMTLFCFSVILLVYYRNRIWLDYKIHHRLVFNAESAVQYVLSRELHDFDYDERFAFDLYGKGLDSVCILKSHWGVFDRISVTAFSRELKIKKSFIVGKKESFVDLTALYVSNECALPVTLIGNASIKGDVYLPTGGIKGGILDKQVFTGDSFVNGNVFRSTMNLPDFKDDFLFKYKHYQHFYPSFVSKNGSNSKSNKIVNSFLDESLVLSPKDISSNIDSIIGNIIVFSDENIRFSSTVFFDNVLVIAPSVFIESGFKGNLQVFCKDSIIIDDNSLLTYPSVLAVQDHENALISVGRGSEVSGLVAMINTDDKDITHGCVILNQESLVTGQVITQGSLSVKGSVNGSVFCRTLFYDKGSGNYLNYLVNAVIDRNSLPKDYVFMDLFHLENEENSYELIEWIY